MTTEKFKHGFTWEELQEAFTDLLDGKSEHEIMEQTGLSKERCKEIENLYWAVVRYNGWNK